MMTKYHCGEECGLKYKTTGIKWRKCWLLNKLPYWENEKIYIRISIKRLPESDQWQQGILHIEPPIKDKFYPDRVDTEFVISDTFFEFKPPLEINRWWMTDLLVRYFEFAPYKMKCTLELKTANGTICTIPIADISVVDGSEFLKSGITAGIAMVALIISFVALLRGC